MIWLMKSRSAGSDADGQSNLQSASQEGHRLPVLGSPASATHGISTKHVRWVVLLPNGPMATASRLTMVTASTSFARSTKGKEKAGAAIPRSSMRRIGYG